MELDDVVIDGKRVTHGQLVRTRSVVFDRASPRLMNASPDEVGTCIKFVYAGEIRETLVHVEYGSMVAVVNVLALTLADM